MVRRIAIIKCWETNYSLDPVNFLSELSDRQYDWADLSRLIKHNMSLTPAAIFERIRHDYRFLVEMDPEEAILAGDAYKRERKVYQNLFESLRKG
jgi:hypothetical protein